MDSNKQFLIFGQEPDSFKGSFDRYQALQGKISQFNWWSSLLHASTINGFAKCNQTEKGNIVSWDKKHFDINSQVIELDSTAFCNPPEKWLFFRGRRNNQKANTLCAAHGGWIVVPRNSEENKKAVDMYQKNQEGCVQDGSTAVGWLGVRYYNEKYFTSPFAKHREANYTNYRRYLKVIHIHISRFDWNS